MDPQEQNNITSQVEAALDSMRPFLESDGGNIEIVEISDDFVVKLRFLGACKNCKISFMTMKAGVTEAIKKAIPQIKEVEAINMLPAV